MILFDYLYYKACRFYADYDKDGAGLSGLAVVVLIQWFHIFTVYSIILLVFDQPAGASKPTAIILYVILLILNGIRYNKLNKAGPRERWDGETDNQR
jgi:hypothetical protein